MCKFGDFFWLSLASYISSESRALPAACSNLAVFSGLSLCINTHYFFCLSAVRFASLSHFQGCGGGWWGGVNGGGGEEDKKKYWPFYLKWKKSILLFFSFSIISKMAGTSPSRKCQI